MKTIEQTLRDELVNLWHQDLAEREFNGPNRSKMIDGINKRLHVPMASPYCIGGLLVRGVEILCTKYKLANPIVMTASTQEFWQRAPKRFSNIASSKIKSKKSDICVLQNKGDKEHGHAYGLTLDESEKHSTIEYNTNIQGSRDGDGVHELTRSRAGTEKKIYLGSVDVIAWILEANPRFKI